jgi:exonuclease III
MINLDYDNQHSLKVYSQNIFGFPNLLYAPSRLHFFLKNVVKEKYDIIFLQEVFIESWLDLNTRAIKKFKADYFIVYSKKKVPVKVIDNYSEFQIEGGLVTLVKKSAIDNINQLEASFNNFDKQASLKNLLSWQWVNLLNNKGYLVTDIRVNNQIIRLINTHTAAVIDSTDLQDFSVKKSKVLQTQIKEIGALLKQNEASHVIIGGDFNINLKSLSQNDFDLSSFLLLDNNMHTLPKHNTSIDWLLVNKLNFDTNSVKILPINGFKIFEFLKIQSSDHCGVTAKVWL